MTIHEITATTATVELTADELSYLASAVHLKIQKAVARERNNQRHIDRDPEIVAKRTRLNNAGKARGGEMLAQLDDIQTKIHLLCD